MKLLQVFEELRTARPLAKDTLANYQRACVYFGNFLGRDADLDDLKPSVINNYLASCEDRYHPRYVRSLRRDLLIVWNYAADCEYCSHPKSRLIRISKIPDNPPQAWPLDWIPKLMAAAQEVSGNLRGTDCPRSWYADAYVRAQVDLLCRPTDMRHLLWSQLEQDGTVRFVQHKTGKHHTAKLHRDTVRAINKLVGLDATYIFPLGKTSTELLIAKVFKLAKIEKPQGQSLGHLRHTGGSAIASQIGKDAARNALGHTPNSRVFEKHYLDPTTQQPTKAVKWW